MTMHAAAVRAVFSPASIPAGSHREGKALRGRFRHGHRRHSMDCSASQWPGTYRLPTPLPVIAHCSLIRARLNQGPVSNDYLEYEKKIGTSGVSVKPLTESRRMLKERAGKRIDLSDDPKVEAESVDVGAVIAGDARRTAAARLRVRSVRLRVLLGARNALWSFLVGCVGGIALQ